MICASTKATPIPISGDGARLDQRAANAAAIITEMPRTAGVQRACPMFITTSARLPNVEPDVLEAGDAIPRITSSCEISIMAPMPQENPETTACGTLCAYLPRCRAQKTSMKMLAAMEILAAPPMPCCRTAMATKGTVALAVPPMRRGLRPRSAVTGPVRIEVKIPRTGGNPIRDAIANP